MYVHRHMSMFISMQFCCLVDRPDCPWQNLSLSLTVSPCFFINIPAPTCLYLFACVYMFLAVSLPFPVHWSDIPVPLSVPICQLDSICACLSTCPCLYILVYKAGCVGLQVCLCPAMILSVCVYICADYDFSFSVDLVYILPSWSMWVLTKSLKIAKMGLQNENKT